MSADSQPVKVFTIGHSNHSLERFVSILKTHDIEAVADVRSQPRSRYAPHFSRSSLSVALEQAGVRYVFLGDQLGGRPPEPEMYDGDRVLYWRLAECDRFSDGLDRLMEGTARMRVAVMCSEGRPDKCHRDLLVMRALTDRAPGRFNVTHLLPDGSSRPGDPYPSALVSPDTSWQSQVPVKRPS